MKNNKKGFTLIELLAVIVVLAIIMVIATTQVTQTINKARAHSFRSSFDMMYKSMKTSALQDMDADAAKKALDFSDDYDVTLTKDGSTYTLTVCAVGVTMAEDGKSESGDATTDKKFAQIKLTGLSSNYDDFTDHCIRDSFTAS